MSLSSNKLLVGSQASSCYCFILSKVPEKGPETHKGRYGGGVCELDLDQVHPFHFFSYLTLEMFPNPLSLTS